MSQQPSPPDGSGSRPRHAADPVWPRRVLLIGLFGLVVVAVLLSRRQGTPSVFGIAEERLEPVGHVAVAAVIAAAQASLSRSRAGRARRVAVAFLFSATITTLIEIGQSTVADRAVSGEDVVMNLLGAAVGSLVAAIPGTHSRLGERVAAVATIAALGAGLVALQVDPRLGRGCSEVTVVETAAVPAPDTAAMSDLYVYDFEEPDPSLGSPGPWLSSTEEVRLSGGMAVMSSDREKALMVSQEVGEDVSWLVRTGRRFVVEVVATPSELRSKHVPIVGISRDQSPSDMNFAVGIRGDRLSVRLRMGCGQFNWTQIDDVFTEGEPRRIAMTVVDDTQRIWVDGTLVDERRFGGGMYDDTRNWDLEMAFVVGNQRYGDGQFEGSIDSVRLGALPSEPQG
ncbi:MAG: VanZ family protein [Actinomycetota bacterium]